MRIEYIYRSLSKLRWGLWDHLRGHLTVDFAYSLNGFASLNSGLPENPRSQLDVSFDFVAHSVSEPR